MVFIGKLIASVYTALKPSIGGSLALSLTVFNIVWLCEYILPVDRGRPSYFVAKAFSIISGLLAAKTAMLAASRMNTPDVRNAARILTISFVVFLISLFITVYWVSFFHIPSAILIYIGGIWSAGMGDFGPFGFFAAGLIDLIVVSLGVYIVQMIWALTPIFMDFPEKKQKIADSIHGRDTIKGIINYKKTRGSLPSNKKVPQPICINVKGKGSIIVGSINYLHYNGIDYYIKFATEKEIQVLIGGLDINYAMEVFKKGSPYRGTIALMTDSSYYDTEKIYVGVNYEGRFVVFDISPSNEASELLVYMKDVKKEDNGISSTMVINGETFKRI